MTSSPRPIVVWRFSLSLCVSRRRVKFWIPGQRAAAGLLLRVFFCWMLRTEEPQQGHLLRPRGLFFVQFRGPDFGPIFGAGDPDHFQHLVGPRKKSQGAIDFQKAGFWAQEPCPFFLRIPWAWKHIRVSRRAWTRHVMASTVTAGLREQPQHRMACRQGGRRQRVSAACEQ